MRKFKFTQNKYYHLCNRSNSGEPIFLEERDYARFLFFILYYQAPVSLYNIGRQTFYFSKYSKFNVPEETVNQIISQRRVELNAFTVMPNHFHILAQEKNSAGKGIPWYLQRIETGYAKYFNTKYKKRGHIFQGRFRAIPIETDEQLLYLSAYIHRNPRDLKEWENKEIRYPWSGYQDCIKENRWKNLLVPNIFLDQFSTKNSYRQFVDTSTAKLKPIKPIIKDLLLE